MRIAHVVVAAATMAGRGQFFWGPAGRVSRWPAWHSSPEGHQPGRAQIDQGTNPGLTGTFCALWPEGSRLGSPHSGPFDTRGSGLLRCDSRGAQRTHC